MKDFKTQKQIENVETFFENEHLRWKSLYKEKYIPTDLAKIKRKIISSNFISKYLQKNSKILDVGCGAGMVSLELVNQGYKIEGIDVSKKMINLCEEQFKSLKINRDKFKFKEGNIFELDLKENSYDGIIALGFLEYQKIESTSLDYLYKILKPNGFIVISGPNNLRLYNYFNLVKIIEKMRNIFFLKSKENSRDYETISLHRYNIHKFKKLFINSNFTYLECKQHSYAGLRYLNKLIGIKGQFFLYVLFSKFFEFIKINRFADDIIVVGKKVDKN